MEPDPILLSLQLFDPVGDPEKLEEQAEELRQALLALDLDELNSGTVIKPTSHREGAYVGERSGTLVIGALVISLIGGKVLPAVLELVRTQIIERKLSVEIELDGRKLRMEGGTQRFHDQQIRRIMNEYEKIVDDDDR